MQSLTQAARAYQAATNHRSQRDQEADVFRYASGALMAARSADLIRRVQAIADNRRLWITVATLPCLSIRTAITLPPAVLGAD